MFGLPCHLHHNLPILIKSAFRNISTLQLSHTSFSSFHQFRLLVCSFPSLLSLSLTRIWFRAYTRLYRRNNDGLSDTAMEKLKRFPPSMAISLQSLELHYINGANFEEHQILSWISRTSITQTLERLEWMCGDTDDREPHLSFECFFRVLGQSLRTITTDYTTLESHVLAGYSLKMNQPHPYELTIINIIRDKHLTAMEEY
ncbi:hypothetical protein C8Q75DRAFT_358475 [Abortiporus biennis]|nr:hypothetical protein C8Q75DRAFT_358475 [Abortiporus biennis]